jgi:hypothetical protein
MGARDGADELHRSTSKFPARLALSASIAEVCDRFVNHPYTAYFRAGYVGACGADLGTTDRGARAIPAGMSWLDILTMLMISAALTGTVWLGFWAATLLTR